MGLRWERKLLDHVDWFPSQPKWTYRLETSVLDVKIPVAAPVSQQPLSPPAPPLCHPASFHRHRSLAPPSPSRASPISLCPSFSLVPFIRPFVCIGRKRCNGWTRSGKSEIPFSSDIKLYPPSPLPLFSASSFRWARLRANTFCEQTSRHKWNRLVDLYYFQGSERITRKSEYIVVVALLSFPPFFFFFFSNPFRYDRRFNRGYYQLWLDDYPWRGETDSKRVTFSSFFVISQPDTIDRVIVEQLRFVSFRIERRRLIIYENFFFFLSEM